MKRKTTWSVKEVRNDDFEVQCPECFHENLYLVEAGGDLHCSKCGVLIVTPSDLNGDNDKYLNKYDILLEA